MASIGRGARNKGAKFERDTAALLSKEFGVPMKRTGSQERWGTYPGDINAPKHITTILNDFFWELKCRESLGKTLLDWYKKAKDDAGGSKQIPLVVTTKNHEDDYVFLTLKDFTRILYELEGYRKDEQINPEV